MTRVTLLTTGDCVLCEHAKETLDRLAAEVSVRVETIDIASPRGHALATRSGMPFPPAVFLDGEAFCYGRLSERKLRRELLRRAAQPRV